MKVAVITCSDRSAAGSRADLSGAALADGLVAAGHELVARTVVPDQVEPIQAALRAAIAAGADGVFTTGGTGLAPTDVTPEAIAAILDKQLPGIAEALRSAPRERVPTSVLSRGVAGIVGSTFVVSLPGSTGAVRDGLELLIPLLDHIADQLGGGDHRPAVGSE